MHKLFFKTEDHIICSVLHLFNLTIFCGLVDPPTTVQQVSSLVSADAQGSMVWMCPSLLNKGMLLGDPKKH